MAKNHLLENNKSISQIASDLGYSSLPHFSYAFKKKFGLSPAKYESHKINLLDCIVPGINLR